MMASPDEKIYEECMIDVHTEEEEDSDDSDQDPTFDIIDDTRSKLSSLSIKKTPKSRLGKERIGDEEEKGENDSYQIVEGIIRAGQLEKLKVEQCKVYLRKHGLRLTGNKDTLIQRIREHLDVTSGGGEHKYPVSSFVVNCKGDACTGDVVLFEQNVYEMYSIASRSATGPPCGTRLVAGRIVKESYGAEKQQHTFTIEVLWSTGEKPLPPLHPLLIKGRNLYRLKTMRQKWEDEGERQKMLSEKHARGHVARSNRETRVWEKEMRKNMRQGKMEEQKRPTSANIAMNTMKEQRPQKPPNLESHIGNVQMERHHHQFQHPGSQHNLESHISNGQMERRHHQHLHPGNQHNLQSHTGNVLMERHHHQYQQPGRQPLKEITHSLNPLNSVQRPMIMEDKKKPTPVNIAMNTMEALKPPENKPSNLETHIGNVLLERQRHQYQLPLTPPENKPGNLETRIGNALLERHRHQYQHPGSQHNPGNVLLERHRHQYQHPGSQHNPGNVLLERHHHQYQHPGSQPLASTNYNFPRDHLGQNMSNNSLNSVQRASHYGSYGSHNSVSGKHGANMDAHFMRENPVHGHFQEKKQQACRYFAQGRCHFGDRCKLLHEDPRIQKLH